MSDEKLTKIWPTPMENSGFCDRIFWIARSLKFHLQDRFLVCHVALFYFNFWWYLDCIMKHRKCFMRVIFSLEMLIRIVKKATLQVNKLT